MSDLADLADHIIHAEIASCRARIQQAATLQATGCCLFCGEDVAERVRFCNVECRDDYELEQAARQRSGLRT